MRKIDCFSFFSHCLPMNVQVVRGWDAAQSLLWRQGTRIRKKSLHTHFTQSMCSACHALLRQGQTVSMRCDEAQAKERKKKQNEKERTKWAKNNELCIDAQKIMWDNCFKRLLNLLLQWRTFKKCMIKREVHLSIWLWCWWFICCWFVLNSPNCCWRCFGHRCDCLKKLAIFGSLCLIEYDISAWYQK